MKLLVSFLTILLLCAGICAQAAINIGQKTLLLNDSARERPLKTEIWYPTKDDFKESDLNLPIPFVRENTVRNGLVSIEKFPLILISHGFGGGRTTLEWLAAGLARKGFIVAAVDHFGNTYDNLIIERSVEFLERPKDISFVLTNLLEKSEFKDSIDEKRIGAVGFSIGGFTIIALAGGELDSRKLFAYAQTPGGQKEFKVPEAPPDAEFKVTPAMTEYYKKTSPAVKDERIKAVFAISPAIGQGFQNKSQFRHVDIPVFILAGEEDSIAPVKTNAEHYSKLIKNSKIEIIKGKVGHYVFLDQANDDLTKTLPVFYADDESVSRSSVHKKTIELTAEFFKRNLK